MNDESCTEQKQFPLRDNSDEGDKPLEVTHPIGHVGEPHEIAYGVLHLASDESNIATGTALIFNGGSIAMSRTRWSPFKV